MPVRGCSSISCRPAALQRVERRLDVGHLVGDVVQARALLGQEPARPGVSGPSGASSSTWFSPTSSSTASTPCSATTSRWASVQLEAVAVELERRLDLLDGDADVVDAAEHPPQSIVARRRLADAGGAIGAGGAGAARRSGRDDAQADARRALQARHARP